MDNLRGALWNKWDLHIHTPESIINHYTGNQSDIWEEFLIDIESLPSEFKVLGINDYLFIDGYKRILKERENGRLSNIDSVFPVIELRVDKFGGSKSKLSKVNFHIIFSDNIKPEIIETQFINGLTSKFKLSPQYDHLKSDWQAIITKGSLKDLGDLIIESVPEIEKGKFGDPLIEGFNNLTFSSKVIWENLKNHYFKNKYLTAVGKTEWADIKWNDHSIADKKTVINDVDMVFTSSDNSERLDKSRESLKLANVNYRLLDCSDAHYNSSSNEKDRIGKCFTWVKGNTSFQGLVHAINEYDRRIYLGEEPPKLKLVRENSSKYIKTISINKTKDATTDQTWFNQSIPINHDMVAVIGKKGCGKSALTDIIGLLANSHQSEYFTFLHKDKFLNPRSKLASSFKSNITWLNDISSEKLLSDNIDSSMEETVKYIPQGYFEIICNQIGAIEDTHFDKELKKVIFSHTPQTERLNFDTLDKIIIHKTEAINRSVENDKIDLKELNKNIHDIEKTISDENVKFIENKLADRKQELKDHDSNKPSTKKEPKTTNQYETIQKEIGEIKTDLGLIADEENTITKNVTQNNTIKAGLESVQINLRTINDNIQLFLKDNRDQLANAGINIDDIFHYKLDESPVVNKLVELHKQNLDFSNQLESTDTGSIKFRKTKLNERFDKITESLKGVEKEYQKYVSDLDAWTERRNEIVGDKTKADTITYIEQYLKEIEKFPLELNVLKNERKNKTRSIFNKKMELVNKLRQLYKPVQNFIDQHKFAKNDLQIQFDVSIIDTGISEGLFKHISHGSMGTFYETISGEERLKKLISNYDLNEENSVIDFCDELIDNLKHDKRHKTMPKVKIENLLKTGSSVEDIYNFIYSLEYLTPRHILKMMGKELKELSPGERGTLLFVFYLLIDKGRIPLIIDQPEGNLDNETIYKIITHCVDEARKRRQIIIVTHNPNIAVVCDAEQIIHAEIDKTNKNKVIYTSGAIESIQINKCLLNVLEGTRPALENRIIKYY